MRSLGIRTLFGFLRPRWGIRGSLFVAFAVIAGMTIAISGGAGMVLRHLGVTMVDLSGRDIPRLAASLQLSAQSARLAAQGPALLTSQTSDTLAERAKKLRAIQQSTQAKRGGSMGPASSKTVVAAPGDTFKSRN